MAVLLLAQHNGSLLSSETAKVLSAALLVSNEVDILVAGGQNACKVAYEAASLKGVRKIVLAQCESLNQGLEEPLVNLIISLSHFYSCFMANAGIEGKNIMPRLAALLGVSQVSAITEISSPTLFKRLLYSGRIAQLIQSVQKKQVLTVRSSCFLPASKTEHLASIESVSAPSSCFLSRCVSKEFHKNTRSDLTSAKIIVSGGRAFGSLENFERLLVPLAHKLGAAIGASRAAVDAGYASNDLQIGQTGKIVAPDLYIACGISGAAQHIVGIQDSKTIVAINNDPEAPIFKIADYGIVGDLFVLLPELYKAL